MQRNSPNAERWRGGFGLYAHPDGVSLFFEAAVIPESVVFVAPFSKARRFSDGAKRIPQYVNSRRL